MFLQHVEDVPCSFFCLVQLTPAHVFNFCGKPAGCSLFEKWNLWLFRQIQSQKVKISGEQLVCIEISFFGCSAPRFIQKQTKSCGKNNFELGLVFFFAEEKHFLFEASDRNQAILRS